MGKPKTSQAVMKRLGEDGKWGLSEHSSKFDHCQNTINEENLNWLSVSGGQRCRCTFHKAGSLCDQELPDLKQWCRERWAQVKDFKFPKMNFPVLKIFLRFSPLPA
jgi:hypothetical protein